MTQNAYHDLTVQNFVHLCALVEAIGQEHAPSLLPGVIEEVQALWGHLAWIDGRIDPYERRVLEAIGRQAEAMGDFGPLLPLPADGEPRPLPDFLRLAAEGDPHGKDRRVGQMVAYLETIGFGLAAADREIRDDEHAALRGYVRDLRRKIEEVRAASRPL